MSAMCDRSLMTTYQRVKNVVSSGGFTSPPPLEAVSQLKRAFEAVANGNPSVGLKASHGVVVATGNRLGALYGAHIPHFVTAIDKHIGAAFSGLCPDYRLLVKRANQTASDYRYAHKEPIGVPQLMNGVGTFMLEYIQPGGTRPFGASMLICGSHQKDYYIPLQAVAQGVNAKECNIFLADQYKADLRIEEAAPLAVRCLKKAFGNALTGVTVEVGICMASRFQVQKPTTVAELMAKWA
ncbi:proteasome subunit alpha type-2-like [Drosophila pseudoobscura]|uniref:Proteasome subunit alpha type-2-like n=1 Tax=Drosophila pseudoobscura pseudoobscura TaxID=46245 RepID=A0A6I8WCS8_DROPS|nr:proteasome subunit alpha type-2-like [Drosophila pseudoobscura]